MERGLTEIKDQETRTTNGTFEVRSNEDGSVTMVGYAAKFNTRSQDLGGFVETIAPGAFTRSLEEGADVKALFNHDPNIVLGRSTAGTLRLSQDGIGLRYEVDLPNTTAGRDLAISLERGDINQSSFAFRAIDQDWSFDADGRDLRTLKDLELRDVSPVTYPAYLDTDSGIAQRSLNAAREARTPKPNLRAMEIEGMALSNALETIEIGD
ncbi:HK97 family phage prohead protease [Streptomyces cadmiisoli]|uniref:HK97 family phage prohead protease n=2 Tax=Streptomyces cadmiisoli TaxID=2184053 RepID=A0A2Z4J8R9_9ACTN|nr:HK97 family phage prohead protease [Streptomyces cadmiisoli]